MYNGLFASRTRYTRIPSVPLGQQVDIAYIRGRLTVLEDFYQDGSSGMTRTYLEATKIAGKEHCPKGCTALIRTYIYWQEDGVQSHSVCNHTSDHTRESDLLITNMITDRHRTTRSPLTN